MQSTRNVLGLDVGERRIGVALASLSGRIASPLLTIDRQKVSNIFEYIDSLIDTHDVSDVVIGLPRGMSGQETAQTAIAQKFAYDVAQRSKVAVHMQDEAGTSLMAEEELKSKRRNYEKGDIDKLAATYILSDWLTEVYREVAS